MIVVYDSGLGGLNVLKKCLEILPNEQYLYFADTKNVPYGVKKEADIRQCVFANFSFLQQNYPIKAVVLACNTATSAAIDFLRKEFAGQFPIVGMEPAVKEALMCFSAKEILLTATDFTLRSKRFSDLCQKVNHLKDDFSTLSFQKLVYFAENNIFDDPSIYEYLEEQKEKLANQLSIKAIVLGCTHFIYYRKQIAKVFGNLPFFDGTSGVANRLKSLIVESKVKKTAFDVSFVLSQNIEAEIRKYQTIFQNLLATTID